MKKYIIAGGIVFVCIFAATRWTTNSEETSPTRVPNQLSTPKNISTKLASASFQDAPKRAECQMTPIAQGPKNYVAPNEKHNDALLEQAYINPAKVLAGAEQDPEAYVALYNLTTACFPDLMRPGLVKKRFIQGCPSFSMQMKGHPIQLLERAAKLGSVEAKLAFAMNARLYRDFFVTSEGGVIKDNSKDIISQAEKYGAEAAQAGHPDAYRYMSQAYENGTFGVRNKERALAFILPLQETGLPTDKERIKHLSSKLTEKERKLANAIAFGCQDDSRDSFHLNPFQ
jgi:hypothetical protein